MGDVVHEQNGKSSWMVVTSEFGGFEVYMDNLFQYEASSLEQAIAWIEGCEE